MEIEYGYSIYRGKSKSLFEYVSKYSTKNERAQLIDLVEDLQNKEKIHLNFFLYYGRKERRECSSYEVADRLTGKSMYRMSEQVVWLDVNLKRKRVLKNYSLSISKLFSLKCHE